MTQTAPQVIAAEVMEVSSLVTEIFAMGAITALLGVFCLALLLKMFGPLFFREGDRDAS